MTSRPTNAKLLLIAEGRAATPAGVSVAVRRYRLARVALGGGPAAGKTSAAPRI